MRSVVTYLVFSLALVLLFAFFGCREECLLCSGIRATGQVVYVPLEGGFFGIVGDNGVRYEPVNLPEEFQVDGLRVLFIAEHVDGASAHMWGELIRLTHIEAVPFGEGSGT
ncbi:MAG: hypothetical protein ABDK93_05760 [Atribacterota bacterium]